MPEAPNGRNNVKLLEKARNRSPELREVHNIMNKKRPMIDEYNKTKVEIDTAQFENRTMTRKFDSLIDQDDLCKLARDAEKHGLSSSHIAGKASKMLQMKYKDKIVRELS